MHYDRVTVVDHPMVQHKLSKLRNKNTSSKDFRALVRELAMFRATRPRAIWRLRTSRLKRPSARLRASRWPARRWSSSPSCARASAWLRGLQELMPSTFVGHLGMYRDPETHEPHEYYAKLPDSISQRDVLVVDPMLATGGSATAAIHYLRKLGVKNIKLVVLVAAPVGIEAVLSADPDVQIYTCAVDECLNDHAYIVPGLGDAGDRIFGTK